MILAKDKTVKGEIGSKKKQKKEEDREDQFSEEKRIRMRADKEREWRNERRGTARVSWETCGAYPPPPLLSQSM